MGEDQRHVRAAGQPEPCRRVEMASKNLLFAHPIIGEKPIGRLRAGPVLDNRGVPLQPDKSLSQRDFLTSRGPMLLPVVRNPG